MTAGLAHATGSLSDYVTVIGCLVFLTTLALYSLAAYRAEKRGVQ